MNTSDTRPPRPIAHWAMLAGTIILVGFVGRTLMSPAERLPSAASAAAAAPAEALGDEVSGAASVDPVAVDPVAAQPAGSPDAPSPTTTIAPVADPSLRPDPGSVTDDLAAGTTTSTTTSTIAPATAVGPSELGYPAAPDGTPLPVVVVYDTDTITLTGAVPSERAKERLGLLAVANGQHEATLVNQLVVNERVPISVGVRVVELESVRFPEGSSDVLPEHSAQLERVAAVLNGLPHVTVLVIGHADQRGDAATNLALSDARARSVVNYLTYLGIAPTRISSRAAGETELLTLDDDATSLALNRRTEFIFYGVLVE